MIEAIYIAKQKDGEQLPMDKAMLEKGKGIVGDRAYGKIKEPGQNITFVEAEEIDNYNNAYRQNISQHATRRNVVTRGVRLNDLVDKEFTIGKVKFRGVELCEPCSKLGGLLENDSMAKKDVVRALVHRAGLRADVLSDGEIAVGMPLIQA